MPTTLTTQPRGFDQILRDVWRELRPLDLEPDERLELLDYRGVTHDTLRDEWIIRAEYYRVDRSGRILDGSYVPGEISLSARELVMHRGDRHGGLVRFLMHHLDRLIRDLRLAAPVAVTAAPAPLPGLPEPAERPRHLSLWERLRLDEYREAA